MGPVKEKKPAITRIAKGMPKHIITILLNILVFHSGWHRPELAGPGWQLALSPGMNHPSPYRI